VGPEEPSLSARHPSLGRIWQAIAAPIIVFVGLAAFGSCGALAGTPNLSAVVLSQTLPGFVAAPPGDANGPITNASASNLGLNQDPAAAQQLQNGALTGYVRIWANPQNGDRVAIFALSINDGLSAGSFLGGFNHGMSSDATETFDVPGIAGAQGFTDHIPLSGRPATEYAVSFARGDTVFEVEVLTVSNELTVNSILSVASTQAAAAPGSQQSPITPPTNSGSTGDPTLHISYVIGECVPPFVLLIVIVWLV
jgi:hypothetical protein